MNKFKKVLAAGLALALSVSLLAGCGEQVNDKDEQGRTVISVGNWPTSEGKQLDSWNARKARFEEANPDVVVEPDMWVFDRKTFYAKAAGGQLPTYYKAGLTEIPEIMSAGYSADLTDALKKRGYDGMINPKLLDIVTNDDGKVVALPSDPYVLGLAYNTKLFEQAGLMEADGTPKQPKDWYEVAEFAVKIKEATGKPGIIVNTAENAGGWIFTAIAWSFGVDFMEKDENGKWKATFATPECAEALQWYKDLKWKYDVIPSNTLVSNSEAYKLVGTGAGAMYVTAGDIVKQLVKYGMPVEDFGMMALPKGPKRHVTLLGGNVYVMNPNATADQIDAGLRWYEGANSFKLTEEYKANVIADKEKDLADGCHIGIKSMSVWSENSETLPYLNGVIDEYANANPNHVRLYNEFVANCPADIQAEEPVCCQELYATLDNCIQEVLTNENADPAELLKKAAADFQANYLDNLTY